jgi:predicted permease
LVAAEIASSLILVVTAGLLVETLRHIDGLKPGFDGRNVLAADASLQDARYQTSQNVNRLFKTSLEQMRRAPGVEGAAVALTLPYERPLNTGFRAPDGRQFAVEMVYLTPGYFSLMKIPLLRGRDILDSDTTEGSKVAVVSESFAAKYFHGSEVLGQPLNMGKNDSPTIVGVVGDVQQHSGISAGSPLSIEPTVYVPASQLTDANFRLIHTWFSPKWVVRSSSPVAGLSRAIQAAVASADPQLPVARFRTIDELQAFITRQQRYHAVLFSIMAGLALLLAGLGLYGLLSQMVAQRAHEIGVRLALGATPRQVMASVMRSGVILTTAGVGAGLLISLSGMRFLRHLLWGVRPEDPVILVLSAGVLFLIAMAATAAPAVRILRFDPAETLRQE